MQYKLLKDFETPCFTIRKGVIKTECEWMNVMPKLQEGDCIIKKDWFRKYTPFDDLMAFLNSFSPDQKRMFDDLELYSEDDLIKFGTFICKKSVSNIVGGQDYFDEWKSSR